MLICMYPLFIDILFDVKIEGLNLTPKFFFKKKRERENKSINVFNIEQGINYEKRHCGNNFTIFLLSCAASITK